MRHKLRAFLVIELLAVLVLIALVAFIFFPFVAKMDEHTPQGWVKDGWLPAGSKRHLLSYGNPMPGAVLRFRDASHHVVATVTADSAGEFRRADLRKFSDDTVDGFALVGASPSTGGPNGIYWFVPTTRMIASFHNAAGKAMPDVPVMLESTSWFTKNRWISLTSSQDGNVMLSDIPVCADYDIKSGDNRYVVGKVTRTLGSAGIHYDVTLNAPATILGRLISLEADRLSASWHL